VKEGRNLHGPVFISARGVKDGYMKLKTLAVGPHLNIPKCENMLAKLQKSDKNSDNSVQPNILFTKNASYNERHHRLLCVCIYAYVCVCVCVCVYIHTNTHTHTPVGENITKKLAFKKALRVLTSQLYFRKMCSRVATLV